MDRSQTPGKVSPLIRGARWSFLLVGVVYGSVRYSSLSKKEKIRKEEIERTRPEREAKAKAEKMRLAREEEIELAKQVGVELPPQPSS